MRVELRQMKLPDGRLVPRHAILICETEAESKILDAVCGEKVSVDGLIATPSCEVRLSDGFGEHYVALGSHYVAIPAKKET